MSMFHDALRVIVSPPPPLPLPVLAGAPPAAARRLDRLFHTLATTDDAIAAGETEDLIWALWTSHDDAEAEASLDRAIHHIAAREFEPAEALLDSLLVLQPGYAEAWNKRATLYFLMRRDPESISDIVRTLALEPRHFGAICGFAQICLRHGQRAEALAAFEAALQINPHMAGPRAAVEALNAEFRSSSH